MIPNFIGACYRVKWMFHISNINTQFISHIFYTAHSVPGK